MKVFKLTPDVTDPESILISGKTAPGREEGDLRGTPGLAGCAAGKGRLGAVDGGSGRLQIDQAVRR